MAILNICNHRILLRTIVIYFVRGKYHLHGLFAVKVDGSHVIAEISLYENLFTYSRYDITSFNFKSEMFMKMTFSFGKIYYNFSQGNSNITNI